MNQTSNKIGLFRAYKDIIDEHGIYMIELLLHPDTKYATDDKDKIRESEIIKLLKDCSIQVDVDNAVDLYTVKELTRALNVMRVTIYAEDAVPFHLDQMGARAEAHIAGLAKELPRMIEVYKEAGNHRSLISAKVYEDLLAAIKCAESYQKQRDKVFGRAAERKRRSLWKRDAIFLSVCLEKVERSGWL